MPIPILTYHQIDAPAPRGSPMRGLAVSPQDFAAQMQWLAWLGYTGLSMGALTPYLRGVLQGKVVGITLDDGYLNNLENALPVLQRHGFSATCYMVSNGAGGTNAWDAAKGIAAKPLMNAAQLRQWVSGGQEVGAHTCDHEDLTTLSDAAAQQQIEACKGQLEAWVGARVEHFCYPYGAYSAQHVAMVRAAGYTSATTTRRGRVHGASPDAPLLELPRVPVSRTTTRAALWLKLATAYEDHKGERP